MGNIAVITVYSIYLCREEKQEMWIGKRLLTESFSHEEVISKEWEKKPDPYIIFKDLLKSCTTTQVLFYFSSFNNYNW